MELHRDILYGRLPGFRSHSVRVFKNFEGDLYMCLCRRLRLQLRLMERHKVQGYGALWPPTSVGCDGNRQRQTLTAILCISTFFTLAEEGVHQCPQVTYLDVLFLDAI